MWYLILPIPDLCPLSYFANVKVIRPVYLAENDPWPITNSMRNVITSFSIRRVPCFIGKKVLKENPLGSGIFGGRKDYLHVKNSLKTGN